MPNCILSAGCSPTFWKHRPEHNGHCSTSLRYKRFCGFRGGECWGCDGLGCYHTLLYISTGLPSEHVASISSMFLLNVCVDHEDHSLSLLVFTFLFYKFDSTGIKPSLEITSLIRLRNRCSNTSWFALCSNLSVLKYQLPSYIPFRGAVNSNNISDCFIFLFSFVFRTHYMFRQSEISLRFTALPNVIETDATGF